MKKVLNILSKILLIITILLILGIIIFNLIIIIKILFFGIKVGGHYPDSIWFSEQKLIGISGIRTYYSVWSELVLIVEVPIMIISIFYQYVYFRFIKSRIKRNKKI